MFKKKKCIESHASIWDFLRRCFSPKTIFRILHTGAEIPVFMNSKPYHDGELELHLSNFSLRKKKIDVLEVNRGLIYIFATWDVLKACI